MVKPHYNKFYYREAFCYNREISMSQQTACTDGDLLMGRRQCSYSSSRQLSDSSEKYVKFSGPRLCEEGRGGWSARGRGRADRRPRCLQTLRMLVLETSLEINHLEHCFSNCRWQLIMGHMISLVGCNPPA